MMVDIEVVLKTAGYLAATGILGVFGYLLRVQYEKLEKVVTDLAAYKVHVSDGYARKTDFERLEVKLDTMRTDVNSGLQHIAEKILLSGK